MFVDLKKQYRASLKSSDTEEHIDLAFYRPIGFAWAYLFRKLGVTPNAVTIASIFIGVGAGICFYFNDLWTNVVGMLLLVWANSFDSCDGQLARMTGNYSPLGRILDGLSGDLWFVAIYAAICARVDATMPWWSEHPLLIWIIAAVTGFCHAKQAAMADYYRQFHLFFIKGQSGSELSRTGQLRRQYAAVPWKGHFWRKAVMSVYLGYTQQQEALTPQMQRLRATIVRIYPDGVIPKDVSERFRALSFPLLKFTNFLTFNWRTIFLFISLFIGLPWLYFAVELTLFNIVLAYMVVRHEHICKEFNNSLTTND